jgi:S1-C subfamily serine protease
LLEVPMPNNSALIVQFRKAKTMTAFTQGRLFSSISIRPRNCCLRSPIALPPSQKNGIAGAGDFAVVPKPAVRRRRAQPNATAPKAARSISKAGTGFVISSSGHVVTNQHVVDGCTGDILGNLTGEPAVKLRLVSSD